MSEFIELLPDTELQKLEKANAILKEMVLTQKEIKEVDVVAKLDKLYRSDEENSKAFEYLISKRKNNVPLCGLKTADDISGFNNVVPKMFCDLIRAIENGDLIWKDA